jgi:homoserine kinase
VSGFDVFGVALSYTMKFEAEYVPNARKINFILYGEGEKLLLKGEKIPLAVNARNF